MEAYPQLAELVKYIQQAQKIKGIKHCFYWVNDKAVQFTLSLHLRKANEEMEWWMHESSEAGQRMLWFYRTNDMGVIYPQILDAVGAPDPSRDQPEEEVPTSLLETLGNISYSTPGNKYNTPGSTLAAQQQQSNRPPLTKLLSGSLESIPLTSIIQVSAKEDATGRLVIESPEGAEGSINFLHGRPVHATTPTQSGLEALLELCTWMQGKISFTQGTKADTTTINQSVEQVLYLAAQLIENIGFLQEHQIDDMAVLTRTSNAISEQAFEKRILDGPPLGLELQKRFFQNLDGNRTLKDVSVLLSLNPSQWIAIATNLLKLGLVLTPDGRNVIEDTSQPNAAPAQTITGSFFLSGTSKEAAPSDRFGRSQDHQSISGSRQEQQQFQSTSGQFPQSSTPNQAISGQFKQQATSGSFATQPPSQATSGQFPLKQGNWGAAQQPAQQGAPLLPPSNMFGAGSPAGGGDLPSPAVQAFMSATTTLQDVDTVHVGIQTTEVFFNKATPKAVMTALTDPATGILTFEAMQFFLEREFARSFRFGATFSLMVFCMKLRTEGKPNMPASKIVALTTSAIGKIKHDVDIFGHFGEKGYGLILPNSNSGLAATLVDKITTNLSKFAPELAQTRPTFYFGIASVPNDAKNIETLVANTQKAMQEAVKKNVTRVLFTDIGR